jgi:hypothetical protein
MLIADTERGNRPVFTRVEGTGFSGARTMAFVTDELVASRSEDDDFDLRRRGAGRTLGRVPANENRKGLRFEAPVPAEELQPGQIVVVDGRVVETAPDPDDPERIRVGVARLLAGVEEHADEGIVVVSVPRDMRRATARPFEGTPPGE